MSYPLCLRVTKCFSGAKMIVICLVFALNPEKGVPKLFAEPKRNFCLDAKKEAGEIKGGGEDLYWKKKNKKLCNYEQRGAGGGCVVNQHACLTTSVWVLSPHTRPPPHVIVAVLRSDGEAKGKRAASELFAEKIYSCTGSEKRVPKLFAEPKSNF